MNLLGNLLALELQQPVSVSQWWFQLGCSPCSFVNQRSELNSLDFAVDFEGKLGRVAAYSAVSDCLGTTLFQ